MLATNPRDEPPAGKKRGRKAFSRPPDPYPESPHSRRGLSGSTPRKPQGKPDFSASPSPARTSPAVIRLGEGVPVRWVLVRGLCPPAARRLGGGALPAAKLEKAHPPSTLPPVAFRPAGRTSGDARSFKDRGPGNGRCFQEPLGARQRGIFFLSGPRAARVARMDAAQARMEMSIRTPSRVSQPATGRVAMRRDGGDADSDQGSD